MSKVHWQDVYRGARVLVALLCDGYEGSLPRLCHGNGVRSREAAKSNRVSCDGNRILPPSGGFGSEEAKGRPRDQMSLMVEGVVYSGMDIEKALGGSRRLEPLHLALSSPHNLIGVFSAIILSEASLVRGD